MTEDVFHDIVEFGEQFKSQSSIQYRGVEQLVARRAHNPKVVGSNPSPATKKPQHPEGCFFTCMSGSRWLRPARADARTSYTCSYPVFRCPRPARRRMTVAGGWHFFMNISGRHYCRTNIKYRERFLDKHRVDMLIYGLQGSKDALWGRFKRRKKLNGLLKSRVPH